MDHFFLLILIIFLTSLVAGIIQLYRLRFNPKRTIKFIRDELHRPNEVMDLVQSYFTGIVAPSVQIYTGFLILLFVLSAHSSSVKSFWDNYVGDIHELDVFFFLLGFFLILNPTFHLLKSYLPKNKQKMKRKRKK
jgi:hypothetical protein